MQVIVVVDSVKDWPIRFQGGSLVTGREYLSDALYGELKNAKVINLCRSYRYQSTGYYVSLLAEARGHKAIPKITTIQDLKSQSMIRMVSEELDNTIQRSMSHLQSDDFTLSIYFGKNMARRYEKLSQHIFKRFPSPFIRARFVYSSKSSRWFMKSLGVLDAKDIPAEHMKFVIEAAGDFLLKKSMPGPRRHAFRYDLAILINSEEAESPSDEQAIQSFAKAAESLGMATELITREDYGRLAEFDALFIRETTQVNHHTFRFARKAAAEGLVVIDDPESILKCTNKVFLASLLERHRVLTPRTVIVHRDNVRSLPGILEFPVILKKPDSSFSQGVIKVENESELAKQCEIMLSKSDLIIAQEYMPTDYDWRIGVLDRKPLFACKYFMASEHWQILRRDSSGAKLEDGLSETLLVEDAPRGAVRTALRAARLIGDGFYGVDVKQVGRKFYVIEVNDNPNVDHGVEDEKLKGALYSTVMKVILGRIERKKGVAGR